MNKVVRFSIKYLLPYIVLIVVALIVWGPMDPVKTNSIKLSIQNVPEEDLEKIVSFLLDKEFLQHVESKYPDYRGSLKERILLKVDRKVDALSGDSETVIQLGFRYRSSEDLAEDAKGISYMFGQRAEFIISRYRRG